MSGIFSEILGSDDSNLATAVSRQFQDDPYLSLKKEKKKGKKKSKKIKKLSKKQKKQKKEIKRLKKQHESQKNQQTEPPVQKLTGECMDTILRFAYETGYRQGYSSSVNSIIPENTVIALPERRDGDG